MTFLPSRPVALTAYARRCAAALATCLMMAGPSGAMPPEIAGIIAADAPLGTADARVIGVPLYRAELWAPGQAAFGWDQPFALSLTYRKGFSAETLARASVDEIARIQERDEAEFAALAPVLEDCFADVDRDDRITGVNLSPDEALFFVNGQQSCTVSYPAFGRLFFGIWLDPRSRDPDSAARLMGKP